MSAENTPTTPSITPPAPPTRRPWWLLVVLLALGGGGYWWSQRAEKPAGSRYRTAAVEKRTLIRRVEASGHLAVRQRMEVPSLLSGRLVDVMAKAGDTVKKDAVLARLEALPNQSSPGVMIAQRPALQAALEKAEADLAAGTDALHQTEALVKQGIAGSNELQLAKMKIENAKTARKVAQGNLAAWRATLNEAGRLASFAELRAPIDGVILTARDPDGSLVGPASGSLFLMADTLDVLSLEAEVSELDVAALRKDQPAEVMVDALPGEVFPAKIVEVGLVPARNGSLVTYPVTFELQNPAVGTSGEHKLRPGQSATARVEADRVTDVMAVPEAALRFVLPDAPPADDRTRVFRLGAGDSPESVAVRPGLNDGAFTEIRAGESGLPLEVGDELIIGGLTSRDTGPKAGLNLGGKKP